MPPLLSVRGLRTEFLTPHGTVRAADGVDFDIEPGEVLGLVGESGCGKSVTALSIMYLIPTPPGRIAAGEVWFRGINLLAGSQGEAVLRSGFRGKLRLVRNDRLLRKHRARMGKIRGRQLSMIFQEPMASLNPVLPVGYQIAEVLMYQRRKEICDRLLSRHELTPADLELFRQAVSNPEPSQRERFLADFCLETSLPVERVMAIIERSGLSFDDRIARVRALSERAGPRHAWFLRLVRELDDVESQLVSREWRILSGTASQEDANQHLALSARFQSLRLAFRAVMGIPILRRFLMRPIEQEARRRVLIQLKLVRIPEPHKVYGEYPHELSGGMQQRAVIAMALACDPALVIADEPTTSLDVTTQAQILRLIQDLRKRIQSSILYITHDLAVIAELCDRVAVMYAGKIVEDASVRELFAEPLHPYTEGLLESIVSLESETSGSTPLPTIAGSVPDLANPPTGCRFHPRCKYAFERCKAEEPRLLPHGPGRRVACFLYEEGGARAVARPTGP
ncbi:MAG: ABC transporter ATP-binding protein [Thermoplasmata archaeon]|nr:ABC transporter ATP-binding protein [Thermoplasmata archaeon]